MAELDKRQARIVELKFFGGLTVEEVAEVLGVSESTVKREWSNGAGVADDKIELIFKKNLRV